MKSIIFPAVVPAFCISPSRQHLVLAIDNRAAGPYNNTCIDTHPPVFLSETASLPGMMKELHSEIEIAASAGQVWAILTDFANYPQWNPFILHARGNLLAGERLEVMLQPAGAGGMTFSPTVLTVEADRELRWIGHLFVPGLFDGEHIFTIEPLGTGSVRFIQREIFTCLSPG